MKNYKFICNDRGTETIKTFSTENFTDAVIHFKKFLLGCGFYVDGKIFGHPYNELVEQLKGDDGYADVFQANIAMSIQDSFVKKMSPEEANRISNYLMHRIFSVDHYYLKDMSGGPTSDNKQAEFAFED